MTKVIFYVVGYLIEAILSFVFYFFIVKKEIALKSLIFNNLKVISMTIGLVKSEYTLRIDEKEKKIINKTASEFFILLLAGGFLYTVLPIAVYTIFFVYKNLYLCWIVMSGVFVSSIWENIEKFIKCAKEYDDHNIALTHKFERSEHGEKCSLAKAIFICLLSECLVYIITGIIRMIPVIHNMIFEILIFSGLTFFMLPKGIELY